MLNLPNWKQSLYNKYSKEYRQGENWNLFYELVTAGVRHIRRWYLRPPLRREFHEIVIFKSNFCRSEQIYECTKRKGGKPVQPLTSDSRIHRQPQSGKTSSLNLCWKENKNWILGPVVTIYLNISKSICIWWPSVDHFVGPFSLFDGHLYFFPSHQNSLETHFPQCCRL